MKFTKENLPLGMSDQENMCNNSLKEKDFHLLLFFFVPQSENKICQQQA
jgi:hypothetical protein